MGNLSQPETSLLVHFGKERTQQWILMRLEPASGHEMTERLFHRRLIRTGSLRAAVEEAC